MKSFQDKYWEQVTKGHKTMLTAKVRAIVYLLSVFINASIAIVLTEVKLSVWVLGGVAGFNAVVAILAKANVTPDEQ
jgi:hypothetical protein